MLTRRVLAVPGSVMPVDMGPGVLPTRAGPTSSQGFRVVGFFAFTSFAIRSINRAIGSEIPRLPISQRATVFFVTPSFSASPAWVSPRAALTLFSS